MEKHELFQIGDVAKMFHLSVGSLRHYERIGLVMPEYVDQETGYRYYSTRQFECLNTIRYLRVLDMQEVVGMTTTQYITHYKLLRAKDLLKTGEKNIQEVSDYLGFSTVYYFSRLFKQHFEETPSHYMKRHMQRTD